MSNLHFRRLNPKLMQATNLGLDRQRKTHQKLLPVLDQVERELKMQQTLQLLSQSPTALPPASPTSSLLSSTAASPRRKPSPTCSKTWAKRWSSNRAIMIAQYIAIGIAKAFAGMGGGEDLLSTFSSAWHLNDFGDYHQRNPTGRSTGGSCCTPERPYIKSGERGPELFVPNRVGTSSTTPTAVLPWIVTPPTIRSYNSQLTSMPSMVQMNNRGSYADWIVVFVTA